MTRRFTGWHMLAALLLMFGTIIAVNVVMASVAVSTFGGRVVDNSYVASQRFNGWLAQARAQEALGWTIELSRSKGGRLELRTNAPAGAVVTGIAEHPLGREESRALRFTGNNGSFSAAAPPGRWLIKLEVKHGIRVARYVREIRA